MYNQGGGTNPGDIDCRIDGRITSTSKRTDNTTAVGARLDYRICSGG